jgi:DNA-directed RNA polymerase subunit RPC12/RpoP
MSEQHMITYNCTDCGKDTRQSIYSLWFGSCEKCGSKPKKQHKTREEVVQAKTEAWLAAVAAIPNTAP